VQQRDVPPPDYGGVSMARYVHLIPNRNPMTRLLSEGLWLHLPLVRRHVAPLTAAQLVNQMEAMHEQTALACFELADEALPPALLVDVALELLRRGIATHADGAFDDASAPTPTAIGTLEILRQLVHARALTTAFVRSVDEVGPSRALPHAGVRARVQVALNHYALREHLDRDVRAWFDDGELAAASIDPQLVAGILDAPDPREPTGQRLCWLGGAPRWKHGLLTVSCENGELYTAKASEQVAHNLRRCEPTAWVRSPPPGPDDFEDAAWYDGFRERGIVLV
jgi:hypothetical protein